MAREGNALGYRQNKKSKGNFPLKPVTEIIRDLKIPSQLDPREVNALYHASLFTSSLRGFVLEIGSWAGSSAVALALGSENSIVHCIDLFPNREDWSQNKSGKWDYRVKVGGEICGARDIESDHWNRVLQPVYNSHPHLLDYFTENTARAGVKERVYPYKGTSSFHLWHMPVNSFRLAFIDGGHDYESVKKDIENVFRVLTPGGWMIFDDAFCGFSGVDQALSECILGNPLYEHGQRITERFFSVKKR
jgi:predicted O-methyltransferase YrrM